MSHCNRERTEVMRADQNKRWRGKHQSVQNKRPGPSRYTGHNTHNRFYESNGPNVKVRGPASLIAEKYQQLARDAQTSGDLIAAEGYLQPPSTTIACSPLRRTNFASRSLHSAERSFPMSWPRPQPPIAISCALGLSLFARG
jgi:hypothetical protein